MYVMVFLYEGQTTQLPLPPKPKKSKKRLALVWKAMLVVWKFL
jgi:hypothetical protein